MAVSGIDTSGVTAAATTTNNKSNSSLDKDAFLQLLVAQMQYQDPLEPTSNTEYMAQLAQFSTVEELQNVNTTIANSQSLSLTGQYVILNVPDAAGNINPVSGIVDYVTISEGKTYLHIGDEYYPAEYLDSVVSYDYLEYISRDDTTTEGADGTTDSSDDSKGETDGSNSKTDETEEA